MAVNRPARTRAARWGATAALVAAGAVGGGVLAGTFTADAATTGGGSSTYAAPSGEGADRATFPAHGTDAHEALEKPVTGSAADQAKAAAVKEVGSGTAGDVTTDVSGSGYEVTVTKSDGSQVEVHLDQSFGVDDHAQNGG
jgi:hypothetical protein